MTAVDLGPADLADGALRTAAAGGLDLVVARSSGRHVAFEQWCPHAECPLGDGWLEGDAIRCACHGALFALEDGAVLDGPAPEPIVVFAVRQTADGRLEAEIPTLGP